MSHIAEILLLLAAIDAALALVVGALVTLWLNNVKEDLQRTPEKVAPYFRKAMLYMFSFSAMVFSVVHAWAWMPYSVSEPITPFINCIWAALVVSLTYTAIWVLLFHKALIIKGNGSS